MNCRTYIMTDVSYRMSPALTNVPPAPVPPTIRRRAMKQVSFSREVVSGTTQVPSYDRKAVPSDSFSCDVCSVRIPSGIRGYEPYGTCGICEDGFDVCGACCGTAKIMRLCGPFVPGTIQPTLRLANHPHDLQVIDRAAEVRWANGDSLALATATTITGVSSSLKKKRSNPRGRSRSPKKEKKPKVKND